MAGSGEAVKDHRGKGGGVLAQDGEGVVLGGAGVNRNRQLKARGELELRLEGAELVGAGGVVAVVVEAGLAEGANLGVHGGLLDGFELCGIEALGVVRMAADDREDVVVRTGRLEGALGHHAADGSGVSTRGKSCPSSPICAPPSTAP